MPHLLYSAIFIHVLTPAKTQFAKRIKMLVFIGSEDCFPLPPHQINSSENIPGLLGVWRVP